MISIEKAKIHSCLQSIDEALAEGGRVYKNYQKISKLTASLYKQIMDCEGQLLQISHA